MKLKPSTLIPLLCAMLVEIPAAHSTPPITVMGQEHIYEIPRRLEKNYSSIIYPGEITGDDTGSTALLEISHEDFPDLGLAQPWEATLLLFWDRNYGANGGIASSGRKLAEDAEPAGQVGAFHRYHRSLGTYQPDYYFSFDPDEFDSGDSDGSYFVDAYRSEAVEIGPVKKPSRLLCTLHSAFDGTAIQLSTVGPNCAVENFDTLHAAVSAMFGSWKK